MQCKITTYIYVCVCVCNKSFERMEHLKSLGTTLTNQKSIHEVQIAVRECLLLFDAESFVLHFAVQKYQGQDM